MLSDYNGRKQAQASTVSSKRTMSKRRSSKEKPEELCQVTNRHACRIEQQTYDSVMKYRHVTTFADEQKTKDMPLHSQTVITATAIKSPSKSGGLRKRDLLRSETKLTIVSSNGAHGMDDRLLVEMYKSGVLNPIVSYMKKIRDGGDDPFDVLTKVPTTPTNVTKLSSEEQVDAFKTARTQSRARAKTGRSLKEIYDDLGDEADQWLVG